MFFFHRKLTDLEPEGEPRREGHGDDAGGGGGHHEDGTHRRRRCLLQGVQEDRGVELPGSDGSNTYFAGYPAFQIPGYRISGRILGLLIGQKTKTNY